MKDKKRKAEAAAAAPKAKGPRTEAAQTAKSAISDVFSSLKMKKKTEPVKEEPKAAAQPKPNSATSKAAATKKKPKAASQQKDDNDMFADSRGLKAGARWVDGLRIYTPEELGLHEGGGDTPLCPFDCECCV
uniref:DUF1764 domain-containing protein n=1 Tax=Eutreptiella gymnastica TaxID=73025 RepID=A0A7S1JF46_9EUGL